MSRPVEVRLDRTLYGLGVQFQLPRADAHRLAADVVAVIAEADAATAPPPVAPAEALPPYPPDAAPRVPEGA
jgi:hypothetical protein